MFGGSQNPLKDTLYLSITINLGRKQLNTFPLLTDTNWFKKNQYDYLSHVKIDRTMADSV